jgi:predicted nucleotidyltransferase component of viral defense system
VTKAPKNIAQSVKERLLTIAKSRREELEQILVRYASERLLYRLSVSKYRDDFILKGAMLFIAWEGMPHRVTRDIDLLGFGDDSVERVASVVRDLCELQVEDDGLVFDTDSVKAEEIRALDEYGGVRVTLVAKMGTAMIRTQVDVGFGDAVTPKPEELEFPTLLDFPKPKLRAYPVETVVAEKLVTIIELGMANSRMKDYFDLLYLSRTREFDGALLAKALRATAERRGVPIPDSEPFGLSAEFGEDAAKRRQWAAFGARTRLAPEWADLSAVVNAISEFLLPVLRSARSEAAPPFKWSNGGWS